MHVVETIRGFEGTVIAPGHPEYEEARGVWNADVDRRPALIARCTSAGDARAAILHARDRDMPIAVRSGGHSIPGWSTCDNGAVIDLSPMKSVHVDRRNRRAVVEPGVIWREFDAAGSRFGLATTGGEVSDTGVAGLTLGGGIGWLKKTAGLACDNLEAAEVVLADGHVVRATQDENPDLFWGLRGGGGNFGVVTRLTFRMHEVATVLGGSLMYPLDRARDVLGLVTELHDVAPDELSVMAALITAPPAPFVPEAMIGSPAVVLGAAWFGGSSDGDRWMARIRAAAPAAVDHIGPMAYPALQQMVDAANPRGLRSYTKAEWLKGLSGDTVDALVAYAAVPSSPRNQILLHPMGGAVSRVAHDDTAFAYRHAAHSLTVVSMWDSPDDDRDAHADWTRAVWRAAKADSAGGAYVNHMDDEGADRIRDAYGAKTFDRLRAVKRSWDPDNVFRLNQNIPPAG